MRKKSLSDIRRHLPLYGMEVDQFFISPSKLTADFRAATSISLHEYISAIRVTRAKMWLSENYPIEIIAQRCGFTHESSFIRMFKSVTGMTPGEYRRRVQGQK